MGKDIEFRGKQHKDGSWIYGAALSYNKQSFIFSPRKINNVWIHETFEVITESVGQYIGLETTFILLGQAEQRKIFEGDVLKVQLPMGGFWGNVKKEKIGIVRYEPDYGGYIVEWDNHKNQHHVKLDCDIAHEAELLGNICDSPKLKERLSSN